MSVLHETVYEDRLGYVDAVKAMGGEIELFTTCLGGPACRFHDSSAVHSAVVRGVSKLQGPHQQKHQPEIPQLSGRAPTRRRRPSAGRAPATVPEPGDQHIHIRRRDRLPAHLRGFPCRAGKYAMSVTASPALITASCAAATNDRPTGNRRNSDVCDKNTRRGGGSLGITHSIPALTQREKPNGRRTVS